MERLSSSEQSPVEKQIEQWKQGPTILASGSEFRRDQLEHVGFSDVSFSEPIPESVETELAIEMKNQDGAPRTYWDSDGMNFSEHIAAAKVAYVLDHQDISPDTLVISFDTTAVIYDNPTEEQYMGVPSSDEKYQSIEEAQHAILKRFTILAEGIVDQKMKLVEHKNIQEMIGSSTEEIEMVVQSNWAVSKRGNIHITTGTAIAFPDNHHSISRFSEEVTLFSDAIAQAEGNEQVLVKLVELIIQTQGEDKTLSISGGIDYADSYVRDILGIREVQLHEKDIVSEALYRGFAPKALETLLHMHAEELEQRLTA